MYSSRHLLLAVVKSLSREVKKEETVHTYSGTYSSIGSNTGITHLYITRNGEQHLAGQGTEMKQEPGETHLAFGVLVG